MRVAIIGAGIIGLSLAWRLRQAGETVTVYDPDPGSGPSTVAAGMLAPVTRRRFDAEPLSALALASARRWPAFAAELGVVDAYRECGSLFVAADETAAAELEETARLYRDFGLHAEPLEPARARTLEPLLHRVHGAMLARDDHQVDPRVVHRRLLEITAGDGVVFRDTRIPHPSAADADVVVIAAGCGAADLGLPVHAVRGQVVRLRGPDDLRFMVRATVGERTAYIVPRRGGEVVIGATSAEAADLTPTAGDVHELLHTAMEVLPGLAKYRFAESNVGLRPGTADGAPLLGYTGDGGVIAATGHYRQGVLLAPITADLLTELITTGRTPEALRPFDPRRSSAK